VFLIANDNGYAAHKVAWLENGKIKTTKIPTAIEMGHKNTTATGENLNAYAVGDTKYTCTNDSTQLISLRHADYPLSPENRVLFTHAIVEAGLEDKVLSAAVTLPFRDYYDEEGRINTDFVQQVATNFKQNNVDIVKGDTLRSINVINVQVTPEAISAWFDWAMNDDGTMNENYEEMNDCDGSMLIVDIGGSTTDIVSVTLRNDNLVVRTDRSSSNKLGVLDAMDSIHAAVGEQLEKDGVKGVTGHGWRLSQKLQSQIMSTGKVRLNGKRYDFTEQRNIACANTAQSIVNYMREQVGSTVEYFEIMFVGGGSVVFQPWMKQVMPNAVFSADEFANARGALKFLISQRGE
jgi:plasmid segregation protein ParM